MKCTHHQQYPRSHHSHSARASAWDLNSLLPFLVTGLSCSMLSPGLESQMLTGFFELNIIEWVLYSTSFCAASLEQRSSNEMIDLRMRMLATIEEACFACAASCWTQFFSRHTLH